MMAPRSSNNLASSYRALSDMFARVMGSCGFTFCAFSMSCSASIVGSVAIADSIRFQLQGVAQYVAVVLCCDRIAWSVWLGVRVDAIRSDRHLSLPTFTFIFTTCYAHSNAKVKALMRFLGHQALSLGAPCFTSLPCSVYNDQTVTCLQYASASY